MSASGNWVAESNSQWSSAVSGAGDTTAVGLVQNPGTSGTTQMAAAGGIPGYGNAYFETEYVNNGSPAFDRNTQGSASQGSWIYAWITYTAGGSTFTGYTAPQLYSTSGGYSHTDTNYVSSTGNSIYLGIMGSQSGSYPVGGNWNWGRVRAYPPGGVMPSARPRSWGRCRA